MARLLLMHADAGEDLCEAAAGDIVAVPGLEHTATGDTLCDLKSPILLERLAFPTPVIKAACEADTQQDAEKLQEALAQMVAEDISISLYLSIFLSLSIYIYSLSLSLFLSIYLSLSLCIDLSLSLSLYIYIHMYVCIYIYIYILSLSVSVSLDLSLSLPLSLSIYIYI